MEQTKYDFGNLRIVMSDRLKEEVQKMGIPVAEIHRLVESFGNKLLMTRATGEIDFTNKTNGASMKLVVTWESEDSAVVEITEVNLGQGKSCQAA